MTKRLHDALSAAADRHPEKNAVFMRDSRITYAAWEGASNQLARALRVAGCRAGDRVGLLLPKSIEALIGMFGALKADCIYVPLDTASPVARLGRILQSAECRCLLGLRSTSALLNDLVCRHAISGATIGWMDDGGDPEDGALPAFTWRDVQSLPAGALDSLNRDADVAHILFTSGTTGAPKGVTITHRNVTQFIDWAVRRFGMEAGDRISGHPPFHFDLSTFDIHGCVAVGAELHLAPAELNLLPARLADFIRDSRLTQWFSVPSILTHMAKTNAVEPNGFPFLRRLLWCGEKFSTPALIHWMERLPDVHFFNLYGPTETTIASSCYRVPERPREETAEIPIGEACDGEQLLVLNEQLQPVPAGTIGDLYIGGAGLSPGYWRDSARTAEAFVPIPAEGSATGRIYRTGDLARRDEDDRLYLLGRSDSQIKSRGYRIELGEIEAALHCLSEIRDAAVVAIESEEFGGMAICCAWIPAAGSEATPASLKRRLKQTIPAYMIPAHWMTLDAMPLNGNGKTDRRLLKERFREGAVRQTAIPAPPVDRPDARALLSGAAIT